MPQDLEQIENAGVSKTAMTPEAGGILREIRNFIVVLRGEANDLDSAIDFLHGEDSRHMFDSGDEDIAVREIRAMLNGVEGLEQAEATPQVLSLCLENRRLAKYYSNEAAEKARQENADADALVDGIFRR